MKKNLILITFLTFVFYNLTGQVSLIAGSLDFLKDDGSKKSIQAVYIYDGLYVRDISETEYVAKWVTRKNKKEPGLGDNWKEKWTKDRKTLYEPNFQNSFNETIHNKFIEISNETDSATYILRVKTYYIDPGYPLDASNSGSLAANLAVSGAAGSINCYLQFSKASSPDAVLAVIKVLDATHFGGCDDEGVRISENYSSCGSMLAEFINKKLKKK